MRIKIDSNDNLCFYCFLSNTFWVVICILFLFFVLKNLFSATYRIFLCVSQSLSLFTEVCDQFHTMGDVQRITRINNKIIEIDAIIMGINEQKYNLLAEMDEKNVEGEEFFEYIQEIAEIDQTVWDLKAEKQRLLNLL